MSNSRDVNLNHKLAFMLSGYHLIGNRDDAPEKQKPKALYVAELKMRTQAVGGGDIPEDEIQFDFCVSDAGRDSHYSYMTEKTLRNYAEDAQAGVPFMLNHQDGIEKQIGRSMAASFDDSEKSVTATISVLKDTDATPENMKVNEYVRRIERKYYTSCSVGFRDGKEICRLDGKPIWDWNRDDKCEHLPGETYNGKVCEYDIDDARLREVSLVPAGSNPNAKLMDRSLWPEGLRKAKEEGLAKATGGGGGESTDPKTLLERDGLKWRESLIKTALEEGVRAEDGFDKEAWKTRLEASDSDAIIAFTDTWRKAGDAKWGEGGRKTGEGVPQGAGGSTPAMIFPSYLFEY